MAAKSDKYGDAWSQYRPNTAINFSDVIEDKTIYDTSQATKSSFDPNEITGRSTSYGAYGDSKYRTQSSIDVDAVSVDDILGNSFVENIRHMSQNKHVNADSSLSVNIPRKYTTPLSCDKFNWNQSFPTNQEKMSEMSEQFRPSEEVSIMCSSVLCHLKFSTQWILLYLLVWLICSCDVRSEMSY